MDGQESEPAVWPPHLAKKLPPGYEEAPWQLLGQVERDQRRFEETLLLAAEVRKADRIVDPDSIGESNSERVRGSYPGPCSERHSQVALAKEHVRAIDDSCIVQGFEGSLPQEEVVDALVGG